MNQEEAGRLLYLRCLKIYNNNQDQQKSVRTLHFMLNQFFFQLTRESRVQFTSFFSRIAFVGQAYQFPETLIYDLQWFRKQVLKRLASNSSFSDEFLLEAIRITTDSVFYITKASIPEELSALIPSNSIIERPETRFEGKINSLRVVITDGDPIGRSLLGYEFETSKQVLIRYDVAGINDHFNATVKQIKDLWQHQIMVNLVQINVQADGSLIPEMIILEPDFLIDVTAVARCRDMDRFDHRLSLLQKFQAVPNSLHILLGNIANFFLDELIRKPEQTFESLFKQVFQLNPIGISLFPNHALKQLMSDSRNHYQNLRRVIAQDFPEARINPQDCELEPSFFSAEYGLQGRLDILSIDSEQNELSIVELKSGRPFTKATSTLNLKPDHYVQTLLYDLLIRSVFTDFQDAKKYILYSKLTDQAMRFAPTFKVLQQEALQARNQIIALERQMLLLDEKPFDQPNFLDRLDQGGLSLLSRFNKADLERASDQIRSLKPLQRSYFLAFAAFIAREQYFSRVGDGLQNSRTGMARLWLQSPFEKEENFEIFRQLRLQQEQIKEAEPIVLFQKTALTNAMANFRVGDLALIYPMENESSNALNSRIFRGSIIELEGEWVTFRLRASQSHNHHFQVDSLWNLEPDHYDGSNQLYRNLFEFISMPAQKQNPILGLRPPALPKDLEWEIPANFTTEQKRILKKVLNAEEYFLLLGPPGTGKTKFMLAEMVRQLLKNTKEQILLLAYTNRAVDEICDAIHHFAAESYLRIGKRSSCEAPFRSQLLSDRIKAIGNRSALKTLITQHRIIISNRGEYGQQIRSLGPQSFRSDHCRRGFSNSGTSNYTFARKNQTICPDR